MICKVCNAENVADSVFCENCGAPLTENSAVQNNVPANTAQNPGKAVGMVALIAGIVALAFTVICQFSSCLTGVLSLIPIVGTIASIIVSLFSWVIPPACAIASIVCGIIGMKKSKAAGCNNKMGLIGMILGIVAIVVVIAIAIITALINGVGFLAYILTMIGIASLPGGYGGGYYYG